jgi:uncharacterized protein YndB with AHSA1/START domain
MDGEDAELLSLEFALADPPEKVWRALTEPDIVARWIEPHAERAGGCRYALLDAETGKRVSYRWSDGDSPETVVTFSISTDAVGGTHLKILHSELGSTLAARAANTNRMCLRHAA